MFPEDLIFLESGPFLVPSSLHVLNDCSGSSFPFRNDIVVRLCIVFVVSSQDTEKEVRKEVDEAIAQAKV